MLELILPAKKGFIGSCANTGAADSAAGTDTMSDEGVVAETAVVAAFAGFGGFGASLSLSSSGMFSAFLAEV